MKKKKCVRIFLISIKKIIKKTKNNLKRIYNAIANFKDQIINGNFVKKVVEIFLIFKAFVFAIIDVVKPSLVTDDTYISLAPVKNADKDGTYCDALKYAINNNEIKNIAITGNYGSGKSSVIKTFFNKLENKKYNPIYVSLAAFNKNDYIEKINSESNGKDKVLEIQSKNEFYHTLEKSVLQQLLYQAKESEVPLSRFKRISKHSKILHHLLTIGIIASIIIIILFIKPNVINSIISNYNVIIKTIDNKLIKGLICIFGIITYTIIYKLIFFLLTKFNISKFKIKDAEVEIDSKPESIFNKYLDEIIYFFQVTNHNVVVIEDLDRYEGNASFIFQKLRELNTLINASNQVKYEVDFIYAIKDDFFKDYEERTKFFDYIIPIIPISSKGNSNEIIWNRLEYLKKNNKLNYKFNKEFIDDIAVLIEDKRLIDNIINEFIIYKNKMQREHMDDKQLFSIIAYKNIYPKEYANLQKGEGAIIKIFDSKKKEIKKIITELEISKKNIEEEKQEIQKEFLTSTKELKYVLLSSVYSYNSYSSYNRVFQFDGTSISIEEFLSSNVDLDKIANSKIRFRTQNYSYIILDEDEIFKEFGNKAVFIQRWENIEKGKNIKLQELQTDIENIENEIKDVNKMTLKKLSKKYNIDSIFENSNIVEKVFINKGYITEEYKEYITLFIPGNLTREDNEFICAVKIGEELEYEFKLKNIEHILKRLNESDYENKNILNYDLLDYLIRNNYRKEVIKIIEILDKEKNALNFIDGFIEKYQSAKEFIDLLLENSSNLWKKVYCRIGDKEYIDKWIINFLSNDLYLKNIDENFKLYIENHEDIDKYVDENNVEMIILSLKKLNIRLSSVKTITNKTFIEKIYLNNLYVLNSNMIKLIFALKDVEDTYFESKNLTIIFSDEKLKTLKEYLIDNFEEYYNFCYALVEKNENDENIILEVIKDSKIILKIRNEIVRREKFNSYMIEGLQEEIIDTIVKEDKLKVSYENILYLFIKADGLNENVIENIHKHIGEYAEIKINDLDEKYNMEIINQFKINYIFSPLVSLEDLKVLVKTFNIKVEELDNLENKKAIYLITENLVYFSKSNYEYIKEYYKENIIIFIVNNIEEFIDNIQEVEIQGLEELLLESNSISKEHKKIIANNIEISELKSNLLIKIIIDEIIPVTLNEINKNIITDINISFDEKIKFVIYLLGKITDIKDGTEYVHLLGKEYEDINTNKKACNIKCNEKNLNLCNVLKEKKYISSYKNGKKENIIIYNKV